MCVCVLHSAAGFLAHLPHKLANRSADATSLRAAATDMERLRIVQLNVKRFTDQHGKSTAEVCFSPPVSSCVTLVFHIHLHACAGNRRGPRAPVPVARLLQRGAVELCVCLFDSHASSFARCPSFPVFISFWLSFSLSLSLSRFPSVAISLPVSFCLCLSL